MTKSLDDLTPESRPTFDTFLAKLTEAGIPVMVIDVLRTPEEQAKNIKKGVSWTTHSKHLPQPPSMKSAAIDICPFQTWNLYGSNKLQWDARDHVWEKIGKIGEGCGLTWGGRWKEKDLGHFEFNPAPQGRCIHTP